MTSRPGPGIPESLQHRGGGSAYAPGRRAANPQPGRQDSTGDSDGGPAEERVTRVRPKGKPIPLEGIQTTAASDSVRPAPKGKPQLFFGHAAADSAELPHPSQPIFNLPVPPRPGSSAPGDAPRQRILPGGSGVKSEATVKAQSDDAPIPAVVFPAGKTVDLFPWTGSHPEDALSESVVKGGISNKSQIMNETNTARPSLWSNLKNKSGISTLSTLFVAVLEKRQSCSRLTTPNTFKPPPRLTLRDSTRETWLHDLANPTVGLRRLSRTIPHGVTGKVLLEQCLNKNIPIPRALWLAKCVGINEMRAHKRKGQAGTITWVRGWTSAVEQFLDSTVAAIGQQDWKARITYALQFATHLFKEHLLEEDHFLDWILKSLDSCLPERLFIWLLIASIPDFWLNLTCSRRRGKHLAETLLSHAEKLYGPEDDRASTPVIDFLESIIHKLIFQKPACLLLPSSWERHILILEAFARRRSQPEVSRAIAALDARNKRIIRPLQNPFLTSLDPVGRIYRLLDAVDYSTKVHINELAFDCMEITSDACHLTSIVLRWTSSLYRQGSHRVYLATRLLRKWSHLGADVYDGILAYLPQMASDPSKEPRLAFRVIAELVRSKTFPLGRYLQWLIATGSLSHHSDLGLPSAWPLRLITEIPLTGLSEHVRNLRNTLLRGAVYSAEAEEQAIIAAENDISQQLPGLINADIIPDTQPMPKRDLLSSTVQLEIGAWLRQQVMTSAEVVDCIPTKDPSVEVTGTICKITLSDFHVVRTLLEQYDDLSILADVIGIVGTSFDSDVLSATADTLHYHHEAFNAIGAFEPLFERIAMRYAAIRTIRFPERDLLLSLSDLARSADADPQLLQLLSYDLSRYDQKNSLAACSPASDNMADGVASVDSEEEIERILSSGTSMDQQMMTRVFGKIATNFETQLCKGIHQADNFSVWLYRLRSFDETTFDMILASWLGSLLLGHQEQLLTAALPPLVASGCLSFSRFLKTTQECVRSRRSSQPMTALRIAAEGFDKMIPSEQLDGPCRLYDLYRCRLKQDQFCRQRKGGILELVRTMLELESSNPNSEYGKHVSNMISSDSLLKILRHFAVVDMQSLSKLVAAGQQERAGINHDRTKPLLDKLLDPLDKLHLAQKNYEQQVATVVESADELSLPFCQLELQQIFAMNALTTEEAVESVSAALLAAIKTAVEREQPCWPDLISGLESDLTDKIREHAEREIINTSACLCASPAAVVEAGATDNHASIRKYLRVIDATATEGPQEAHASLISSLVERFKGITESLNHIDDAQGRDASFEGASSVQHLCKWLDALLRLAVVHDPSMMQKASHQQQAALLWTLRALFVHTAFENFPATAQYVFDVTILLSDSIHEDVRKQLGRLDVAKAVGDARCAYIFGTVPSPDGWLSLVKPFNISTNPQTVSSPQTPPPLPNPNQLQYSGNQQYNNNPATLQRSLSQQHFQQQAQPQTPNRAYSQYQQHSQPQKMLPQQLQRMASNGNNGPTTQLQQLQQLQQMQALAQQRKTQPSSSHQQRISAVPSQPPTTAKSGSAKKDKMEMKPVPFSLNRWEILPESGGNATGNETAISLGLFGARRV